MLCLVSYAGKAVGALHHIYQLYSALIDLVVVMICKKIGYDM